VSSLMCLEKEMSESYAQCYTETEKQCWRFIVKKDVRRMLGGRKPTIKEAQLLDKFNIVV